MELNEQKLKTILSEQREEFQRYVGAVAEEFTDRLAGVAEMVAQNTEDITSIKEMVDKNTEDITSIKEMVGQNTEDISVIKLDIEFIKSSLKQKVDLTEFSALERRVALLENRR